MREYKFRGLDINCKKMIYGYYSKDSAKYDCIIVKNKGKMIFCPVISSTVGQFTGLKDKNGVEIYEGDVVKHIIGDGHEWSGLHEVIFEQGAFKLLGGNPKGRRYGEIFNWYPQNVEVIGNVHQK